MVSCQGKRKIKKMTSTQRCGLLRMFHGFASGMPHNYFLIKNKIFVGAEKKLREQNYSLEKFLQKVTLHDFKSHFVFLKNLIILFTLSYTRQKIRTDTYYYSNCLKILFLFFKSYQIWIQNF